MKNQNSWLKVSTYSLAIAALAVFSYVTLGHMNQSKLVQTDSFTGSNVTLSDLMDGQYIHSGDSAMAAYKITFTDATGVGNLQGFSVKLTPGNGATFDAGGTHSSILGDIPYGLQIWKDNGGGDFDTSDSKLFTNNSTYTASPTGFYTYNLQLSNADTVSNGDVYYLVFRPDVYGVTDGESVAIGIAANGIATSGTSPTTNEVSSTVTMDAAYPKAVQVFNSTAPSITEGTLLILYFDQAMNPDAMSSWAGTDPANYFYAENPTTYASKTFGTGATVAFSTYQATNDIATITVGADPTIADGDRIWINFPSSLGYWFWQPVIVDFTAPTLDEAYCIDANGDADCADFGDKVVFIFSEPMDQNSLTASDIAEHLITSPGTLNTTSNPTVIWESNTQVSVILRASQTSLVGSTISVLDGAVLDINGNAIDPASPTPTISIPNVLPASNVSFIDPDTTNWGIGPDDISISWEATASGDHYDVYILPHDVALDTSVHNKLNSSPIPLSTTTFVGSDSTYYLSGDSRSNFATYFPFYYYDDSDSYVAYVVVCSATFCSMPVASAPFVFTNDNSGSDYYIEYNWESTFVEGSFPWGWSTIPTNQKVFGLMFSDPMDADTITATTLTLEAGTTPISGTVFYDAENWIAYFKTTESLPASSTLTFELSSSALDAAANSVSYTTTFYTSDTTDTTVPTVNWASPYDDQTFASTLLSSINVGFNEQIDPTTVTAANWSSVPDLTATTFYDPWSQAIVLQLDSSSLQGFTAYAITFSGTGIKDAAGNALGTPYVLNFSTGAENISAPQVNWIDFNLQGFEMGFDLPMKESAVISSLNYTLTCGGVPVGLSAATFSWDSFSTSLHVEGVPLTEGDSCTLILDPNIKATNNVSVASVDQTQTGTVGAIMAGDDFYNDYSDGSGGGWFEIDDCIDCGGLYDNPAVMMWNPINVWPESQIGGMTTNYHFSFPITQSVSDGDKIDIVFPTGFNISSASVTGFWDNKDINGWSDQIVNIDSISVNQATRTATLTLDIDGDGIIGENGDNLYFTIGSIVNSNVPSTNYTLTFTTKDSTGVAIEGPNDFNPISILEPGVGEITVTVLDADTDDPIVGVSVFVSGWNFGMQELTTDISGEASITGIPVDATYGSDAWAWMDGMQVPDGYQPNWTSLYYHLTEIAPTSNQTIYLNPANLQITGTITHTGIGADGDTQVNVWAGGYSSWANKTITLDADGSTNYTLYLADAGYYNVGVDKFYDWNSGYDTSTTAFISPAPSWVSLTASNTSGNPLDQDFALTVADKSIVITVQDQDGQGISNAWCSVSSDYAKSDAWFWTGGPTNTQGVCTNYVGVGDYITNVSVPGMSGQMGQPVTVSETDTSVELTFVISKPDISVTGNVSDLTTGIGIQNANVNCYTNDWMNWANAMTDSNGDFVFLVNAGTWTCEAWAPEIGYVPAATDVDATAFSVTANVTGLNFAYDPSAFANITGTLYQADGITAVPYTWLWAEKINPTTKQWAGYGNGASTDANGAFSIKLPKNQVDETYKVSMWDPTIGQLVLDADADISSGDLALGNVLLPELRSITLNVTNAPSDFDYLYINLFNEDTESWTWTSVNLESGAGENTFSIPDGIYTYHVWIWGLGEVTGTFTVTEDATVNIDFGDYTFVTYTVNVTDEDGDDVSGAYVEAYNETTDSYVSGYTDTNGEATLNLVEDADSTYVIGANDPAYASNATESTAGTEDYTLELTSADSSIAGTATDDSSNPVAYAWVDVLCTDGENEMWTGGFTDGAGNYDIAVPSDVECTVTVKDVDGSYGSESDVSSGETSADITADQSAAYDLLQYDPLTIIVDANENSVISNEYVSVIASSGTLGDDNITVSANETMATPETGTTEALGGIAVDILASDSEGNDVTQFNGTATIKIILTKVQIEELIASGDYTIDDFKTNLGYYNESVGSWVVVNGSTVTAEVQEETGDDYVTVDIDTFIAGYNSTYSGYNDYNIIYTASTNHFTLFAPIVPVGATPPATPAGLVATPGDASVTLTWTKNSEVDMSYYNIWEANVTEGILTTLTQTSCGTTTCTKIISTLTNGTAYAFQIAAVDTGSEASAYCSAVNATPVAGSTPSTGGVVLGGGSSGGAAGEEEVEEAEEVELETSTIAETVYAEAYTITDGVVAESMTLMASGEVAAATFEENTTVTTADGESYTGEISPPSVVTDYEVTPPKGFKVLGSVYEVGPSDLELHFDKPVTLRFPLPETASANDDLSVYYFNETTGEWTDVGGEIKELEDGKLVIEVSVDHFTKFVVMEEETEVVEEAVFDDIVDHWAKDFIEDLYNKGIVSGYDSGNYGPDDYITRAQFTKIAINAFEIETLPPDEIEFMPFKDVSVDEWYAPYVQAAFVWDIVSGYANGTFKPNAYINRAEAMRILLDAAGVDVATTDYDAGFPDVDTDEWYTPYINYAAEHEIVSGYKDGTFGPGNKLTRGEVAKIASLMLQNMTEEVDGVVGLVIDIAM